MEIFFENELSLYLGLYWSKLQVSKHFKNNGLIAFALAFGPQPFQIRPHCKVIKTSMWTFPLKTTYILYKTAPLLCRESKIWLNHTLWFKLKLLMIKNSKMNLTTPFLETKVNLLSTITTNLVIYPK